MKQGCLTPPMTLVTGSRRFRFAGRVFLEGSGSEIPTRFVPASTFRSVASFDASKRSRPIAGRKMRTGHHLLRNRRDRRRTSPLMLPRCQCFFRFRRPRALFLPRRSSDSSSEMEIETLLIISIGGEGWRLGLGLGISRSLS